MKFEEQFPSLKGKSKNGGCKQGHINCVGSENDDLICVGDIKSNCLDKKKVIDVLSKLCLNHDIHPCETINEIKRELHLFDEK